MVTIRTETVIHAPIELCFDMARDMDLHPRTVWPRTKERIVKGKMRGQVSFGEQVTFEATHFGIRQRLTSTVTEYDRPRYFVDEMVSGAFQFLRHKHVFFDRGEMTIMRDELKFAAPYGVIGRWADRYVLKRYMTKFITYRNDKLKQIIEEEWRNQRKN
ncbi:SRPBCC family protein [Paenibacillus guangzhouensis]|uniref:SRPBCC family protein n=1 Tax=Paenibacillus guangzhouensis TaxID=1473112 RepID=UPI001266D01C|nr:SRPBCC family protein [Paenibacillus guangzhouensis]